MEGEMFATEFTAPDVQSAARMAADFIADELAGRFAGARPGTGAPCPDDTTH